MARPKLGEGEEEGWRGRRDGMGRGSDRSYGQSVFFHASIVSFKGAGRLSTLGSQDGLPPSSATVGDQVRK